MRKFIILITLLTFAPTTFSFTLNNNVSAHFAQDEVTVNVSDTDGACSNIGLTKNQLLELVSLAVDRFWNNVPSSRLRLRTGGFVDVSANFETGKLCEQVIFGDICDGPAVDIPKVENNIVVACNTNSEYSGILGIALPNNISGEIIIGSAVLIYAGTNSGFDGKSKDEQISIIAHELGHAIGLGHSQVEEALMYYQSMENQFYLSRDDVKGVTYLYPKQEKLAGVVGCGSIGLPGGGNFWGGLLMMGLWLLLFNGLIKILKSIKTVVFS